MLKHNPPEVPRKKPSSNPIVRFFSSLGPGLITGAADDDPSGIATYSVAGAQLGTSLLWTALLTWPLMAAVQTMCARIGMCTGKGLSAVFRDKYPRWLVIVFSSALLLANVINVAADLAGMADAAQLLSGWHSQLWVLGFGALLAYATVRFQYRQIAAILKWLALSLFSYVLVAVVIRPNWGAVLKETFSPTWPANGAAWAMLVAILGTTISPYLFYWQASQEVEEDKSKGKRTLAERRGATGEEIVSRKLDVATGTFFSNIVMYFIILVTGLTLHRHGVTSIETSAQAAAALEPIAGSFATTLYTCGIVGVGLLSIPTLTGSAAYALAETFGWRQGLDRKYSRARLFYAVVISASILGVAMNFTAINPIRALYWSAIVNGLLAPFLLVAILVVASDRKLMGGQPSSRLGRIMVGVTALVMFAAGVGMFVF